MPPPLVTTPMTGYTVYPDGEYGMCTDAQYINYNVNRNPQCLGSVSIYSTDASMASSYSASVSSAQAAASASASAAARMTANCTIIFGDLIFGKSIDSYFYLGNLGGWADEDTLRKELDGCGYLEGWVWQSIGNDKHQAGCEIGGFDGGCIERAIKSAGGPDLQCYDKPGKHEDQTENEHAMYEAIKDAMSSW